MERKDSMKKTGWIVWFASMSVMLAGCENKDLLRCKEDNVRLTSQVSELQKQLADTQAALDKQKAENIDLQNKAMESITTMLKKEQAQRDKLQAALNESQAALNDCQQKHADTLNQLNALKAENEKLKADIDRLKAAATQAATK